MSTVPEKRKVGSRDYPMSDGKPMAETDHHRQEMMDAIETLEDWFATEPQVYVSGNLLLFYEEGNRRKHISPDTMVVRGVPKGQRLNYLVWEEGQAPQFVIEFTSSSTRKEDSGRKRDLYRDVLKVREYFQFDPFGDYLDPRFQGYRLRAGVYRAIRPVDGRLPSQVLRLHLGQVNEKNLRFWNPLTQAWLPTRAEARDAERLRADAERERADTERDRADVEHDRAEEERLRAEEAEERARRLARRLRELGIDPEA